MAGKCYCLAVTELNTEMGAFCHSPKQILFQYRKQTWFVIEGGVGGEVQHAQRWNRVQAGTVSQRKQPMLQ